MAIAEGSTCAAVFTWNRFPAAPVTLAREHLALTPPPRFLLVNSGIANATDAAVSRPLLDACLEHAVAQSFNRITVDGDTSTNDACVLVATARAPAPPITEPAGEAHQAFSLAVTEVCRTLARAIIRDGEGATKFVSVEVGGCPNTNPQSMKY
jgi:N-acetylglutamate synthase/N-acetylornithine aminotransferase